MGVFDDTLQADESLIKNENALDYEFVPKILPHRKGEQERIASCIKPMLRQRNGRNALLYGVPGIGKTAATRHVLRELDETSDEIYTIYINCWQHNTTYKILKEICEQIGYRFTHNKKTTELYDVVKKYLNKAASAFVFDEIDKAEDYDFLYFILEDIIRKSIILITNEEEFLVNMDSRVKSRLTPETMQFEQYDYDETKDIINTRLDYAFYDDVWDDEALEMIVDRTAAAGDIRPGIFLLREAALEAENDGSKTINAENVETAMERMDKFSINSEEDLDDETQFILDIVEEHSGKKIGDLFDIYQERGGDSVYKTFQRKINKLEEGKFVATEKQTGEGGNTTIVSKKITDYE